MFSSPTDPAYSEDQTLLSRLLLKQSAPDRYISTVPSQYTNRVYGGHTLAQASLAAAQKMEEKILVSFKAYFLTTGDTDEAINYRAQTLRDGKSFTVRSVQAFQSERLLLSWQGLFGIDQEPENPKQANCPQVPNPEDLLPLSQVREQDPESTDGFKWPPAEKWWEHSRPFDVRYIGGLAHEPDLRCYWVRALPVGQATQNEQRAMFAFVSDHSFATTVSHSRGDLAAGIKRGVASLDHDLWFHRDVYAGEWYLFVQHSPFNTDRLGIATGQFFDLNRKLVASVSQQVLRTKT